MMTAGVVLVQAGEESPYPAPKRSVSARAETAIGLPAGFGCRFDRFGWWAALDRLDTIWS